MLPYESLQFEVWGEETKDAYRRRAQAVSDREVSGAGPVGNAVQDALEASASDDDDDAVKSGLQDTAAGYGRFGDPEYYDVLTAERGGRYRQHTRDLLDATTEDQIRLFMCRRHRQCADDPFEPRPLTALERSKDALLYRVVPLVAACVAYDQSKFWCLSQGRWHRLSVVRTACAAGEQRLAPGALACAACVLTTCALKTLCKGGE